MRCELLDELYEDGLEYIDEGDVSRGLRRLISAAAAGHSYALAELENHKAYLLDDNTTQRHLIYELFSNYPTLSADSVTRLWVMVIIPEELIPAAKLPSLSPIERIFELGVALISQAQNESDNKTKRKILNSGLRGLIHTLFYNHEPAARKLEEGAAQIPIAGTTRKYYEHGLAYFNHLQQQLAHQAAYERTNNPLERLEIEIARRSPSPPLTESPIPEEPEQEARVNNHEAFLNSLEPSIRALITYVPTP